MRKAVPGPSPLRKERIGLLRDPLSPAIRQSVFRLQPGHRWRW